MKHPRPNEADSSSRWLLSDWRTSVWVCFWSGHIQSQAVSSGIVMSRCTVPEWRTVCNQWFPCLSMCFTFIIIKFSTFKVERCYNVILVCVKYAIWLVLSRTCHFLTDNSLQSADQQELKLCSAVAEKLRDAVVKFDAYRILQRHRAVLPTIAQHPVYYRN